jgi:hypothetical protein
MRPAPLLISTILLIPLVARCSAGDGGDGGGQMRRSASNEWLVVNGNTLNDIETTWMVYTAQAVVAELPGSRDRQLQIAARAAWWSLKEGIFDTQRPLAYSLCETSGGDENIGPLSSCGTGRAWQVGLGAAQVRMENRSLADLEDLALQLYPDGSVEDVLSRAATEAGYGPDTSPWEAIVYSEGSLRASWLLRSSAIGFTAVERDEVVPECIYGSWTTCYGRGWTTTKRYAPTKAASLNAMDEIEDVLDLLTQ